MSKAGACGYAGGKGGGGNFHLKVGQAKNSGNASHHIATILEAVVIYHIYYCYLE